MNFLLAIYVFVAYLFASVIVFIVAEEKGHGRFAWFCTSLFLSPIIALLALAALPNRERKVRA